MRKMDLMNLRCIGLHHRNPLSVIRYPWSVMNL